MNSVAQTYRLLAGLRLLVEFEGKAADRSRRGLRYIAQISAAMQLPAILIFLVALTLAQVSAQAAQGAHQSAQACVAQGRRYIAQKQFAEAVVALRRCKQITPSSPHPYFYSGVALGESGRLIEAASELAEAVRLGRAQV